MRMETQYDDNDSSSDCEDVLRAMLRTEAAYTPSRCHRQSSFWSVPAFYSERERGAAPHHFCSGTGGGYDDFEVPHEKWRARIADWCYRVVDRFRYDREVVSVSMNFFDRFLVLKREEEAMSASMSTPLDISSYYLYAMTSLFLAVKLHGNQPDEGLEDGGDMTTSVRDPPPKRRKLLTLRNLADLSRGQFTEEDIAEAEEEMLRVLRWRVNPPTPMAFVSHLVQLFPTKAAGSKVGSSFSCPRQRRHDLVLHVLHELSRYLTELAVCLPGVSSRHDPSALSYAAVLASVECVSQKALSREDRAEFVRRAWALSVRMCPGNREAESLRAKMRETFLEDLLTEEGRASDGAEEEGDGHPIAIARAAGFLETRRGSGMAAYGEAAYPPLPSSTFFAPVSPDGSADGSSGGRSGLACSDLNRAKLLRRQSPRTVDAFDEFCPGR